MHKNQNGDTKKRPEIFCSETLLPLAGGSVFRLVRIAMARALELAAGKPSLISNASSDKLATVALEEIAQGKIVFMNKKLGQN